MFAITSTWPMLNVGCGDSYDRRWTNIDLYSDSSAVIQHDLRRGLPFADDAFQVVYHSHVLEHLDRRSAEELMRECYRVLKPGGVCRVVVPDLEFSCRLYLDSLRDVRQKETALTQEHYEWAMLNLIDQMVRQHSGGEMIEFWSRPHLLDVTFIVENGGGEDVQKFRTASVATRSAQPANVPSGPDRRVDGKHLGGLRRLRRTLRVLANILLDRRSDPRASGEVHLWMYDTYSLNRLLRLAGFSNVTVVTAHESSIPDWQSFSLDLIADGSPRKPHSLFVEASK